MFAAWIRDLTDRRAAEEALRQSELQLRQAQKMEAVGRLAGGVAHDFNNVLTAIFGYADLLLDNFAAGDPRRGDVEEIKRAANRAAALTRQLLAFSRKQVMQPRRLNLNDVILNIQKLLAKLLGDEIELRVETDPLLGDVKADPGQIEQVLMNLAANARDAMPEGGRVSIVTANQDVLPEDTTGMVGFVPGAFVTLTVSDTGHGIPDHVRAHIFEPFFTTKEQGKGTGLGLATVYGIVKQSGGWIYLDEAPGRGASFRIYLPRWD
jgi:signal transduction histidine kinase